MKKFNFNKRDVVVLIVLACIILFVNFKYVIGMRINEYLFASQEEKICTKNLNTIFSIDKIVFYSSANAIDNSEGQVLQDLDVCQYTDIAIYLDNTNYIEDLTGANTIKELYIDNIKIKSATEKGEKELKYKNPLSFGKFNISSEEENIDEETEIQNDGKIVYNVVYTNQENDDSDYQNPVFYTDCSNPITLGYMNKNIVKNYTVSEQNNNQIVFDGNILKAVNVDLEDINCDISFDIHIKNNLDEEFLCCVGAEVPLESTSRSIYDGYIYAMKQNLQGLYTFFKI